MTGTTLPDDACDLTISRVFAASPQRVWDACTDPHLLERWWIPAPMECRVDALEVRPGGAFRTRMREAGAEDYTAHLDACFLDVQPWLRLVWTTCLRGGWRPAKPWLAVTATITLTPEGGGTRYHAHVMHDSPEARAKHDEMGFQQGWGSALDQLGALLDRMAAG